MGGVSDTALLCGVTVTRGRGEEKGMEEAACLPTALMSASVRPPQLDGFRHSKVTAAGAD